MIFSKYQDLDIPLDEAVYVALDIETTGVSHVSDRIVELGAVRWRRGEPSIELQDLVNPEIPVKPGAYRIHGLGDEELRGAPSFREIAKEWRDFLEGAVIVAHRGFVFDLPFLNAEFLRAGLEPITSPVIDTAVMAGWMLPFPERGLGKMAEKLGVAGGKRHRALADAKLLLRVWLKILDSLLRAGYRTLADIRQFFRMEVPPLALEALSRARVQGGWVRVLYPSGRRLKEREVAPIFWKRTGLWVWEEGRFKLFSFDKMRIVQ